MLRRRTRIDELPPLPYLDGFVDVGDYLSPRKAINYATATGCVGRCGFCYWHPGYKYSRFPVGRVIDDLLSLKERHGVGNVQFDDGTFFVDPERTVELCERMLDANLDVMWRANARVDTLKRFTVQDMQVVAGSGCDVIHVGLEHGSPRILKLMNKRIDPEGAFMLLGMARLTGITLRFHLLLGNPTETLRDLEVTGALVRELLDFHPDGFDYTVNWFTPYPGCAMTELARAEGYDEPTTLGEFGGLELVNYVDLPGDDREIVKEASPWEADYVVPWFSPKMNRDYMRLFRRVIPRKEEFRTTGGVTESQYV